MEEAETAVVDESLMGKLVVAALDGVGKSVAVGLDMEGVIGIAVATVAAVAVFFKGT
ncbi:MAG TPA: hypothetical protein VMP11_14825 [Verrucomicrobiae bacterium]|nr:hypothetical protein [Verrucomicrobiae bacterium]